MSFRRISGTILVLAAAGCGQNATPPASTSDAGRRSAPAPAADAKPAATLTLIEPVEGAMGGHIDTFRWSPVAGADGYVIKIRRGHRQSHGVGERADGRRPKRKLPTTVALEPEVHTWTVSARKGSEVLATSAPQKFTITP